LDGKPNPITMLDARGMLPVLRATAPYYLPWVWISVSVVMIAFLLPVIAKGGLSSHFSLFDPSPQRNLPGADTSAPTASAPQPVEGQQCICLSVP
jgi:hypothetical protein